jgi:hypothetical protein
MKLFINASRVSEWVIFKFLSSIKYDFDGNDDGEAEGDDGMN